MLIRFSAGNYLSFNSETEFNMVTGDVRRLPNHVYKHVNIDILKSAVIYGANGAGKSNLIKAIELLKLVVEGGNIEPYLNSTRFRLCDNAEPNTSFEVEFMIQNKGYAYGIVFNESGISEEWLYILGFNKRKDELIFERKTRKGGKTKIQMTPRYLKTKKSKILRQVYEEDILKMDVPFLYLVRNKFKEIGLAYTWITEYMLIIFPGTRFTGLAELLANDKDFKKFTNSLIQSFQVGANQIDIETIDFDSYFGEDDKLEKEQIQKQLLNEEVVSVGNKLGHAIALIENGKSVVKKVFTFHHNDTGEKIKFEIDEESDGTQRLLDFIPALYSLIKIPVTVIIDEIDQSIHVALLKEIIRKVQNNTKTQGQLIFTTHESNLLDMELFRQDEVWFAEKNKIGATEFYPLSEFDIRPDLDIKKGYLSGRFGAIPFLGNLKDLNWNKYAKES